MSEPTEQPKTVPARNDFKKQPVFVKATIADQNARPGYRRQWVPFKDEAHPGHVSRYLSPQAVGDAEIGYCQPEPWTVVQRKDAKSGRKRDDDTAGIDTAQTHGDLMLIETPEDNAAIYDTADKLKRQARARSLASGESAVQTADNGGKATLKIGVASGTAGDDPRRAIQQ